MSDHPYAAALLVFGGTLFGAFAYWLSGKYTEWKDRF